MERESIRLNQGNDLIDLSTTPIGTGMNLEETPIGAGLDMNPDPEPTRSSPGINTLQEHLKIRKIF